MDVKFDQHFMKNDKFLDLVVSSSDVDSRDVIFEIGSGPGFLTKKLLERKPKELISCEIDSNFESDLLELKDSYSVEFYYHIGSWANYFDITFFDKLVANIPYSITEPLYTKMLENEVGFAVLLHGKKFYDLILDKESMWHYYVNSFYNVELISEVLGSEFEPEAKVKSVILKLTRREDIGIRDYFFINLFSKRKRSVGNALVFSLVDTYGISKKDAKERILDIKEGFGEEFLKRKFDSLSSEEFVTVVNLLLLEDESKKSL